MALTREDNSPLFAGTVAATLRLIFYLALAIREGTHLVTADTRFARAVRDHKRWAANVMLLSET